MFAKIIKIICKKALANYEAEIFGANSCRTLNINFIHDSAHVEIILRQTFHFIFAESFLGPRKAFFVVFSIVGTI